MLTSFRLLSAPSTKYNNLLEDVEREVELHRYVKSLLYMLVVLVV